MCSTRGTKFPCSDLDGGLLHIAVESSWPSDGLCTQLLPEPTLPQQQALAGINAPITVDEVTCELRALGAGRAAGVDGITAECLQVLDLPAGEASSASAPQAVPTERAYVLVSCACVIPALQ